MRLGDLRELPLPPTTVAERAWELARGRRRRNAVATVAAATVLIGVTAAGVGLTGDGDHPREPKPAPPAPTPTVATSPTVTDLPDFAALALTVPTLVAEDPTYLSDDPVHRAVLAILPAWTTDDQSLVVVDVLGDDGRWRYVDVPGLVPTRDEGGYAGPILTPTGLSPDGTRLALPQPDRVVVVELTTGEASTFDVPGLHDAAVWKDAEHLVVTEEGAARGRVLDLSDGSVTDSTFTASTGFAADGSWVTWGRSRELVSSDGTSVLAEVANEGGLQLTSPLVGDEVAVGIGGHDLEQDGTTYASVAGIPVVDRRSGDLRAFLYTEGPETGRLSTHLLGLDGDWVTLAAGVPPDYATLLVLRWNWRTGEVTPVEVLAAGMVSGSP